MISSPIGSLKPRADGTWNGEYQFFRSAVKWRNCDGSSRCWRSTVWHSANPGMEPNDQSVFAKKYGFYVHLAIVDDPVKARDLFASGQSHILWGDRKSTPL